jgi:calcineurin-like phosphoesterase family protein
MEYFIGDLHNNDENIITYEHRPFKDTREMRDVIIRNWNEIVKDDDIVYLLGDIGDIEILVHLNGKIIIVVGNHDNIEDIRNRYPHIEVCAHPIMVENLWLSHKPIGYMPPEIPYLNIHAHLHRFSYGLTNRLWNKGNRYFCVSVEQINYTPISIDEISKALGISS